MLEKMLWLDHSLAHEGRMIKPLVAENKTHAYMIQLLNYMTHTHKNTDTHMTHSL